MARPRAEAIPLTGTLSLWLFRLDGGYDLGAAAYVGEGDRESPSATRVVAIDDVHVDMDAARVVAAPPLAEGEVRRIKDYERRSRGIYAERGDGKVLLLKRIDPHGFYLPRGPLRWASP